jgi:hypothetical protein
MCTQVAKYVRPNTQNTKGKEKIRHASHVAWFTCDMVAHMWHGSHVTRFTCDMAHMWHGSHVTRFPCDTVPMWHGSHVTRFTCDTVHMWHGSHVTWFTCDTVWHDTQVTWQKNEMLSFEKAGIAWQYSAEHLIQWQGATPNFRWNRLTRREWFSSIRNDHYGWSQAIKKLSTDVPELPFSWL